jgi:site-specific recombinase XerD
MSVNIKKLVENSNFIEQNSFDLETTVRQFAERNNSPETRRTYGTYLREFFTFAKVKTGVQALQVKSETVTAWREQMKEQGKKPNTVKTKLAAIRSFYEHLKHLGLIERNPASVYLVPPPRVGNDPKGRALTATEVRLLLELPKTETIAGARDYALILLMVRTFMRVSEAVSLRDDDFFYNQSSWFVKVKIKGGEVKNVPLPQKVKKAIDHYHFLDRARRALVKTRDREGKFVFMPSVEKITRHDATANVHLTTRHVWYLVGKYGDQLFMSETLKMRKENPDFSESQIKKAFRLTPHDFRRTAITRALDMGESYRRVMNASRHRSITSIQRYDLHREAIEENSILTLNYDED